MNGQNSREIVNASENIEKKELGANSPVVNPDPFADNAPLNAALIQRIPVGGNVVAVDPIDGTIVHEDPTNAGSLAPLLNLEDSEHLRTRWNEIQGKFVDEPRVAVQQADALVSEVVEKITRVFASEHSSLEGQWNQGADVSTEDLRKALQHYRSFFNRLVV
jgi:hypothetical protein